MRAALDIGQRAVGGQHRCRRGDVPDGRRRMNAARTEGRIRGEHALGASLAVGVVVVLAGTHLPARPVDQARQPQELVNHVAAGVRPALRRPAVAGQHIKVLTQPAPGGEAVHPGDDKLGIGQREPGPVGLGAGGRRAGMYLADERGEFRVTSAHPVPQLLGLLTQMLQGRFGGQGAGQHRGLLSDARGPHRRAERRNRQSPRSRVTGWAQPFARTACVPKRHHDDNSSPRRATPPGTDGILCPGRLVDRTSAVAEFDSARHRRRSWPATRTGGNAWCRRSIPRSTTTEPRSSRPQPYASWTRPYWGV